MLTVIVTMSLMTAAMIMTMATVRNNKMKNNHDNDGGNEGDGAFFFRKVVADAYLCW